jgi:hypothetical protein
MNQSNFVLQAKLNYFDLSTSIDDSLHHRQMFNSSNLALSILKMYFGYGSIIFMQTCGDPIFICDPVFI